MYIYVCMYIHRQHSSRSIEVVCNMYTYSYMVVQAVKFNWHHQMRE